MDAPALVSSPTLYVTAHGEILDAQKVDDAPRLQSGFHTLKADRAERIENISVRPSIARRMFRACTRFLFAVLIGVCGTLAWQRYGDQATELAKLQIAAHGPSVAQFLTAAKSALPRLDAAEQKTKPALAASAAASVPAPEPASAPAAELATNVEAKPSLDAADTAALYQEVQYVTSDLAAAKKTIEQLSASQDQLGRTQQQMAQSIAKLQTIEEGINQKLSSVPSTTVPVHLPAPKPVQNRTPRSAHAAPKPLSAAPPVPPGLVR